MLWTSYGETAILGRDVFLLLLLLTLILMCFYGFIVNQFVVRR